MARLHGLWPRWTLVVWLAACAVGCATPQHPTGNSEGFQACAEECAANGRDVRGIAETADAIVCYCGKVIPPEPMQTYFWPELESKPFPTKQRKQRSRFV